MAQITIYNVDGVKTGEVDLDPNALDITVRKALLKEALLSHLDSLRQGTHKTKKRSEVAGGGKKPWRQKGTGRARQGSTRSPQWVGGGHAKTVEPRDYAWRMPLNQRRIATLSSLRRQLEAGKISAVDGLEVATDGKPKTSAIAKFLKKIGLEGRRSLLVSEGLKDNLVLSVRNLEKVHLEERRNLNAGLILRHGNLIFTKGALDALVKDLGEAQAKGE